MVDPSQARPQVSGYDVQGELGRGANSVVYRATRAERRFALKVMSGAQDSGALLRFRREAAALARLHHPSLVHVEEVGELAGRAYLVMELVEGDEVAQRLAGGPLSEPLVRKIAAALAGALGEVHRHGLVHRDLKPHNVMVAANDEVKLIDFGFVAAADGSQADGVLGTPTYASPEQLGVIKRRVDARSDLYALGATLFHCATGQPPFGDRSVSELLQLHATSAPPPTKSLAPGLSPVLAELIDTLLAKDPDDRYQTAAGVLADLGRLDELQAERQAGGAGALRRKDATLNAGDVPLVGRAAELGRLQAAWARTVAGQGGWVQLDGESGSGKTRLARELKVDADRAGALVLFGKCQLGDTIPLGPFREALEGLAAQIGALPAPEKQAWRAALTTAAGRGGAVLARLSKALGALVGATADGVAELERERFYAYVVDFLEGLARARGPLLLHLDDVQWLDDGSLQLLKQLAQRLEEQRLLVLTTARNDAQSAQAVEALVAALPSSLVRVELKPLAADAGAQLVSALLGNRPVDAAFVDRVVALANGNPFTLGEYVRQLFDLGVLEPTGGRWSVVAGALGAVSLPKDVLQLVLGRLKALPAGVAEVLAAAALQGTAFDEGLLPGVVGASAGDVADALKQAERAKVIEAHGPGGWAFLHDKLLEGALAAVSPDGARRFHVAYAQALDVPGDKAPGVVHALARHYAAAGVAHEPVRAFPALVAAGRLALEDYAFAVAAELLSEAKARLDAAKPAPDAQLALFEHLGVACTRTARFVDAHDALGRALALAKDRRTQTRVQHHIARARASEGKDAEAWEELEKAFALAGHRLPRTAVGTLLALGWTWALALVAGATGVGYGRSRGDAQEQRRVLSQLHATASILAYMLQRVGSMLLVAMRELLNSHFLGTSPEHARARSYYGAILSLLRLTSPGQRHGRQAIAMGEGLGDKGVVALTKFYFALNLEYGGDVVRAEPIAREALPEVRRYLSPFETTLSLGDLCFQLQARGYARQATELAVDGLGVVDAANNVQQRANQRGLVYSQLTLLGRIAEATVYRREQVELATKHPTVWGSAGLHFSAIFALYEQEELGPELEKHIDAFLAMRMLDYHTRFTYTLIGWTRYDQLRRATASEQAARRAALRKELLRLQLFAVTPLHRCHVLAMQAGLASLEGKHARARALLKKAMRDADAADCPWGRYVVLRERARVARAEGASGEAAAEAQAALELALEHGWGLRAKALRREFVLTARRDGPDTSPRSSLPASASRSWAGQGERKAQALTQVTLAMGRTADLPTQARAALDESARLLAAERAALFVADEHGALSFLAGRDEQGQPLAGLTGYSSTVVRKAFESKKAVVVAGSEEGELLGSQSAVAHDLRSIMAAPLLLRDDALGVIYLDNRLAKGVFTEEDTDTLLAIGSQVAFAVQLAKSAKLEAERAVLAKDLALTAAVQTLLLPKADALQDARLAMAAHYQPATQAGGDWWWCEPLDAQRWLFLLGDVTGHGPASAMVTASVAATFQSLRALQRSGQLAALATKDVLQQLHQALFGLTATSYQMTMSALEVDTSARVLRWYAAGAPPVLRLEPSGKVDVLVVQSTPLGSEALQLAEVERPIVAGERVLLFTDGVSELMQANGRALGLAGVKRLLVATKGKDAQAARDEVAAKLRALQGDRPPDDDVSFVVIDVP